MTVALRAAMQEAQAVRDEAFDVAVRDRLRRCTTGVKISCNACGLFTIGGDEVADDLAVEGVCAVDWG